MIDLQTEQIIPLKTARKLPWLKGRGGKQLDLGTLRRWSIRGVKGIRLESLRVGGTVVTSKEATIRFIERLSSDSTPDRSIPHDRRAVADADRRLDDAGIV